MRNPQVEMTGARQIRVMKVSHRQICVHQAASGEAGALQTHTLEVAAGKATQRQVDAIETSQLVLVHHTQQNAQ